MTSMMSAFTAPPKYALDLPDRIMVGVAGGTASRRRTATTTTPLSQH